MPVPAKNSTVTSARTRLRARARRVLGRAARRAGVARYVRKVVPLPPRLGVIESFRWHAVDGWIVARRGERSIRVGLYVDDVEVAWTNATRRLKRSGPGVARAVHFTLADLWKYVGPPHEVSVRVDGHPLPIVRYGLSFTTDRTAPKSFDELRRLLDEGHIFAQKGHLRLPRSGDEDWQGKVLGVYSQVRRILADEHGLDAFFIYGTLLGLVRENGFIDHDPDFDAAYIATTSDPDQVGVELHRIAMTFIKAGYRVRPNRQLLRIYDDEWTKVDLFPLYFNAAGELRFLYGIASHKKMTRDEWRGVEPMQLGGGEGLVPKNAQDVVELIYGPDWRIPIPGFSWARDRTDRDEAAWLAPELKSDIYWADYYSRTDFDTPSSFASKIAGYDQATAVLDIGCGEGRDAIAFAAAGKSVYGIDRAEQAVARAERRAQGTSGAVSLRYEVCDVAKVPELTATLRAARDGFDGVVVFYLRFLLHALDEPTADELLRVVAELRRPGDLLAAEFRTTDDEALPKVFDEPFRRFIDADALARRLQDDGWTAPEREAGTGLSPFQREDPHLARIVVRAP